MISITSCASSSSKEGARLLLKVTIRFWISQGGPKRLSQSFVRQDQPPHARSAMTAIVSFFGQRNRTREPASQAELRSVLGDLFNAAERHVWTPDPTPLPLATVANWARTHPASQKTSLKALRNLCKGDYGKLKAKSSDNYAT
jgi:hypothetical protein